MRGRGEGRDREASRPSAADDSATRAAPIPGKRTLVEQELGSYPAGSGTTSPPRQAAGGTERVVTDPELAQAIHEVDAKISALEGAQGFEERRRCREELQHALAAAKAQASHPALGPMLRRMASVAGAIFRAEVALARSRDHSADVEGSPDPEAAAIAGTQGPGTQLPHLDQIQESFGRHDIRSIRAHVGGPAASASEALDAKAFAHGNAVGFANAPDLHTAAHEAAHIVQQRSGVHRKALDGGASDPLERHADAVADAVVAGRSAEQLLDAHAGSRSSPVQRSPKQSPHAVREVDRVPAPGDYLVELSPTGDYVFVFNVADLRASAEPAFVGLRAYMREVFPGIDDGIVRQFMAAYKIGLENQAPLPASGRYEMTVHEQLEQTAIEWMFEHHPKLRPQFPHVGGNNTRHEHAGGAGRATMKPSHAKRGPDPVQHQIGQTRVLFDTLARTFPLDPAVRGSSAWPEFLAYVAQHRKELEHLLQPKRGATPATVEELRKLLDAFAKNRIAKEGDSSGDLDGHQDGQHGGVKQGTHGGDVREQREGGQDGGSIYGEQGGSKYGSPQWIPQGRIQVTPQQTTYVAGADVQVELAWDLSVHPEAGEVLLPNHCDYDWSLVRDGKRVDHDGRALLLDNRSTSLTLGDAPGVYSIEVTAKSKHFKTEHHTFTLKAALTVVREADFDQSAFDAAEVTGPKAAFQRDAAGALHLRPDEKATTTKDEIDELAATRGSIDALAKQGKLLPGDQQVVDAQLDQQIAALEKVQAKTRAGTPYVVRGTFISREDSSTIPLQLVMHAMRRDESAGVAHYELILHDTTFGNPVQHPGAASGPIAQTPPAQVYKALELAALGKMLAHLHSNNDYPKGTVHLAAQLLTSDEVWEKTTDTNNTTKKAEHALGIITTIGGLALLVVPGGGAVSAGLFVVTSAAGLASVALEINQRIEKEGELKFDRRLVLDALQVVSTALPYGAMTKVFAEASLVAKGRYLLCMTGLDVAQGFLIGTEVREQLRLIEANTSVQLATASTEEQRKQILDGRDRQIAQVVGGAMVNGSFILISAGAGIKNVVAMTRAGVSFTVREPIATIVKEGRARIEDTLGSGTFDHDGQRVELTHDERAYLEHALVEAQAPGDAPTAKPEDQSKLPAHERTTQRMPAVADPGHDNAPAHDESQAPAHERTTQRMPAVDATMAGGKNAPTKVVFTGRGDTLSVAAARLQPEAGYFDVVVHGDPNAFWILHDGTWTEVTPNSVRSLVRRQPGYQGQPIRLVSCEAGAIDAGIAQAIANGLGVRVKAPTETAWIMPDGSVVVGHDPSNPTGAWREFQPFKNTTQVTPKPGRPAPVTKTGGDTEPAGRTAETTTTIGHGATEAHPVGPEFRVELTDLKVVSRRRANTWTFSIEAPLPNGRETMIAYGDVTLDASGQPEGGPSFVFEKSVTVDGVEGKVQLYNGDQRVSLSDVALDQAITRFKSEFGHSPDTLPGSLAFENKLNFQRAYFKAMQGGATNTAAADTAIRQISFGRARVARGYTDFQVTLGPDEAVDLGAGLGVQHVPSTIDVVARKPSS